MKEQSLEEIWNGDAIKQVRLNMINDVPSKECSRCYAQEQHGFNSNRLAANSKFAKYLPLVNATGLDGSYDDFKLRFYDISASNLCNLKCRSCAPSHSSKWAEEEKRIGNVESAPILWVGKDKNDLFKQVKPHIPHIDHFYFDGGEPLLLEDHYRFLNELITEQRFNTKLSYNTNLTTFKFKDNDVLDLWKQFKQVIVGASLDASYERAEYLRHGTIWNEVVENRKRLMAECPNVYFYINCTVSAFNVQHISDFHKEWVDLGLIQPGDFNINILHTPEFMRVDVLPEHIKQRTKAKIESHIEWLKTFPNTETSVGDFQAIINMMLHDDKSHLLPKFLEEAKRLDSIRGESLFDTYPELRDIG